MTNSKSTKRALFSSALAILVCVAMLVGTTFAWFTDTAKAGVNKIESGKLDVALEMKNSVGEWVNAEGEVLNFVNADGSSDILWEPGVTFKLPDLRVVNNGNLALKFCFRLTFANATQNANGRTLADVLTMNINDWVNTSDSGVLEDAILYAELLPGKTEELSISLTWNPTANDNEYQGLSIDGASITVVATQAQYEKDINGNTYDKDATYPEVWDGKAITPITTTAEDGKYHITTAAELIWLMNNTQTPNSPYYGETLVLDQDIDLNGYTVKGIGSEECNFAGNFDGQGYTISNFVIERSDKDIYAGLFNYVTNGTISNLTVADATINGDQTQVGALVGGLSGNATVKNCSVENATVTANRKVGGAVGYIENATVENVSVKNTTIYTESTDAAQYGKVVGFKNTGAIVNNISDENVIVHTGYASVSSFDNFDAAIKNGCTHVTLKTDVTNDTPPHTGGDNPYHPYIIGDAYTINNGQELTIDLNGEVFAASVRQFRVKNGGKLTITSSKPGGKITINTTDPDFNYAKNAYGMQVEKGGILNIENNVTIEMNVVGVANPVALCINNGTVNINGGELVVYDSAVFTNNISNFGTFNMNGGKITLESKQTNGTSTGFALWGSGVTANLNAGSIVGKGLAYNKAVVTYFGESNVNIADGFVINTTQGPNT